MMWFEQDEIISLIFIHLHPYELFLNNSEIIVAPQEVIDPCRLVCSKWNHFITSEQFCELYFKSVVCHVENLNDKDFQPPLLTFDRVYGGSDLDHRDVQQAETLSILEESSVVKKLSQLGYTWKEHFYWKLLSIIASMRKISIPELKSNMKSTINSLSENQREKLNQILKEWRLQNLYREGFSFLLTPRFLVSIRDNGDFYGVLTRFLTSELIVNNLLVNEQAMKEFLLVPNIESSTKQPLTVFNEIYKALIPESREMTASFQVSGKYLIRAPFLVFTEEFTQEKRKNDPNWSIDYSQITNAWEILSPEQVKIYHEKSYQDKMNYDQALKNFVFTLSL